jgi:hypothetical protein
MAKTVIGLMENIDDARGAVRDLLQSGIAASDIGFMANEKHALPAADADTARESDAASGAITGATLGGIAGLALALAPLAIPGIGPLLAAGPLAAALAAAGVGAVTGGLIGGLMRLGVPEQEAHSYAEALRRGGILVTVAADSAAQAQAALEIMRRRGAVDIDQRAAQWKKQGWKGRFAA